MSKDPNLGALIVHKIPIKDPYFKDLIHDQLIFENNPHVRFEETSDDLADGYYIGAFLTMDPLSSNALKNLTILSKQVQYYWKNKGVEA